MKLLLIPALLLSMGVHAEVTNQSETKVENKEGKKTDKADQLITNRRFRASNGSLSNFSLNTNLSYNGGSLTKPLAADRPNISNAGDTTSIAGMSGTLNTSYRLNTLNRLSLGVGVQMLAPFNSTIDTSDPRAEAEFDKNQGNLDVNNPTLTYTHMNKFFGVQTIVSVGMTEFTAGNFRDVGYQRSANLSVNTMYEFGKTGFSAGALVVGNRYFFDKDDEALLGSQNETVFGLLPQAEYVINDTFNLRTIIRSNWYQNNRAERRSKYLTRPVTQSVGLGISLSRNIFLYPNIQFAYDNLQASNTNVGFSANINMF
ncbi:MAG: hypothetical protein VYA54_06830 [Bdellovibrionota bacterium]|nr:hypothetical protein [Bdellovibrionota bacterium]